MLADLPGYVQASTSFGGTRLDIPSIGLRVPRADGTLAGTALLYKPAVGMTTLGELAAQGDLAHFARMQGVARPARRPAAILFADLEAFLQPVARIFSTAGYSPWADGSSALPTSASSTVAAWSAAT